MYTNIPIGHKKRYKPMDKSKINNLTISGKNKLIAIWMSKQRLESSKTIDLMFELDDEWNRIYQENRTNGFSGAQLIANTHILDLVYGK